QLKWRSVMKALLSISGVVLLAAGMFLGGCSSTYTVKAAQLTREGRIYFQYQEYDQALKVLKESADIDFENSATHYWLGQTYQKKANPHSAIEEYRLAIRFSPALEVAQAALITTLHQVGNLDESIAATRSFLKYKAGRAGDLVLLGKNFAQNGLEHQATMTFQRAQELEPDNPVPSIALADFYLAQGDTEKERENIMVAVAIGPYYPGLARRAGQLGIKVEAPRPQGYPTRTPLQRSLLGWDDK
ncbi:tetratricopeptide repeat protein, partial [Planctomycetota bacterium]